MGHNAFSIYRIVFLEYGVFLKFLSFLNAGMFFLPASFLPCAMELHDLPSHLTPSETFGVFQPELTHLRIGMGEIEATRNSDARQT